MSRLLTAGFTFQVLGCNRLVGQLTAFRPGVTQKLESLYAADLAKTLTIAKAGFVCR